MKPKHSSDPAALRRAAEARLKEKSIASQPKTEADLRRIQHELEVHQIELEMQNEELIAAQAETAALLDRYTDLYDFAPVGYLTLGRDGTILASNLTGARLLNLDRSKLLSLRLAVLVAEPDRPSLNALIENTFANGKWEFCEVEIPREGFTPLFVRIEAVATQDRQECRAAVLDISERHRAETDRERAIEDLKKALARVRQLSGLLPICSTCKKIRDDKGYWSAVEKYVMSHSGATFTHGLCPECRTKFLEEAKALVPAKPASISDG